MKIVKLSLTLVLTIMGLSHSFCQSSDTDLETVVERLNNETSAENGCENQVISIEACTFNFAIECSGQSIGLSFNIDDLERVYTDKADFEDEFETLFFECKEGNNCVTSADGKLPATPVLPIKLSGDKNSDLGEEAVSLFSKMIVSCNAD